MPEDIEVPRVDDGVSIGINLPSTSCIRTGIARDYGAGEIEGAVATDVHPAAAAVSKITSDIAVVEAEGSGRIRK